jgi:hypothetical protein
MAWKAGLDFPIQPGTDLNLSEVEGGRRLDLSDPALQVKGEVEGATGEGIGAADKPGGGVR